MKTEEIIIRKIVAEDGHVFASVDKSHIYSNEIYLAKDDSPENYIEITDEEAEEIENSAKE